ncbi:MAG: molybdenum cofactor biosynthesis protein MoaB, partial [Gemmatimonadota bacterium]
MSQLPEGTAAHRADAQRYATLRAAVLTVTDSRTLETDESGVVLREGLTAAGHTVHERALLPNDEARVR